MASGFFTTGTQSDTEAEEERMFRERTRTRRAIGGGVAGSGGVGFGTPVRLVRRRTVTPNTFTSGGRKRIVPAVPFGLPDSCSTPKSESQSPNSLSSLSFDANIHDKPFDETTSVYFQPVRKRRTSTAIVEDKCRQKMGKVHQPQHHHNQHYHHQKDVVSRRNFRQMQSGAAFYDFYQQQGLEQYLEPPRRKGSTVSYQLAPALTSRHHQRHQFQQQQQQFLCCRKTPQKHRRRQQQQQQPLPLPVPQKRGSKVFSTTMEHDEDDDEIICTSPVFLDQRDSDREREKLSVIKSNRPVSSNVISMITPSQSDCGTDAKMTYNEEETCFAEISGEKVYENLKPMSGAGNSQRQSVNAVDGGFLQPPVPMINTFPGKTGEFELPHHHHHQQQQLFPPMDIADGPELYARLVGLVFFEIRNGQSATTATVTAAQEGLPVAMRQLEELLDFSEQEAREIGPINANFMADDEFVRTNREFCAKITLKLRRTQAISPKEYNFKVKRLHKILDQLKNGHLSGVGGGGGGGSSGHLLNPFAGLKTGNNKISCFLRRLVRIF